MENKDRQIMDVAMKAGNILLESGAEIFRVEETINRIAKYYGVEDSDSFVLSSGIFITAEGKEKQIYARVKHIPLNAVHLERVAAVNQLSREIEEGKHTVEQARERLEAIEVMKGKKDLVRMLASGLGAGCFCFVFGGDFFDAFTAFLAGFLLYCFVVWTEKNGKNMSKIVVNIMGGFLATMFAVILYKCHLGTNLDYIIIGSIIPLLPGVSFTNAIRDLADGDYIAGTVRMIDALLVTFGIALGVGLMYTIYYKMTGGPML